MFGGSDKGAPVRKFRSTLVINDEFYFETAQYRLSTRFSVATMASDPPALLAPQLSHLPPRGADKPPPVVLCPALPLENLLFFLSPFLSFMCSWFPQAAFINISISRCWPILESKYLPYSVWITHSATRLIMSVLFWANWMGYLTM